MHSTYNINDYDMWLSYYGNQALQTGFGMEGYRGTPYQRGAGLGSFFKALFRMAIPVFKSVGRQAGKHALAAGANVMSDMVKGEPVFQSLKKHSRAETSKLLHEAGEALQEGEGLGVMPKTINTGVPDVFNKRITRKRKHVTNKRSIISEY
jgi:hypothetical protein